MSRKTDKTRARDSWREKQWYTIIAPPYFGNIDAGETLTDDPDKLVGRVIETTLYDVTGDFSLIHVKIFLKVIEVKGDKAYTEFKGHDLTRDYLRSLVRRGSSRVDGIFDIGTKDGRILRISAVAFTNSRAKTSQEKVMRKIMRDIILDKAEQLSYGEFVQEAVLGKIASEIYNKAKKITPLRKCEVRKSKLLSKSKMKEKVKSRSAAERKAAEVTKEEEEEAAA
ncbi:MAG: 30S ribosomal protein S3ae [Candidatus Freyarchaeum deiterrae]